VSVVLSYLPESVSPLARALEASEGVSLRSSAVEAVAQRVARTRPGPVPAAVSNTSGHSCARLVYLFVFPAIGEGKFRVCS